MCILGDKPVKVKHSVYVTPTSDQTSARRLYLPITPIYCHPTAGSRAFPAAANVLEMPDCPAFALPRLLGRRTSRGERQMVVQTVTASSSSSDQIRLSSRWLVGALTPGNILHVHFLCFTVRYRGRCLQEISADSAWSSWRMIPEPVGAEAPWENRWYSILH